MYTPASPNYTRKASIMKNKTGQESASTSFLLRSVTSYESAAAALLGRVTDLYSSMVHVTSTGRSNVSINVIQICINKEAPVSCPLTRPDPSVFTCVSVWQRPIVIMLLSDFDVILMILARLLPINDFLVYFLLITLSNHGKAMY